MKRGCDVEQFLRSWEIDAEPRLGPRPIRFVFRRPQIVDRDPRPATGTSWSVGVVARWEVARRSSVGLPSDPPPPGGFRASDDVRTTWLRYQGFREGKEPLLSMADACLTLSEGSTGLSGKQGARGHRRSGVRQ